MKLKLNEKPINLRHLDDYVKCPNYAKYNWTNHQLRRSHHLYEPIRNVILSCYQDQANLEKKVAWRTVRDRVHRELAPLLVSKIKAKDYRTVALSVLEQMRSWYLSTFREGPTTCLHNLWLESRVPATGVSIAGTLDAILLSPDQIRIVEVTDNFKDIREALNALSVRAKVWMLKQHGVEVHQIQIVRIDGKQISTDTLTIQDYNDFIYKTERALQWTTGSLKNQIYHPSITSMCESCPYKGVCSW